MKSREALAGIGQRVTEDETGEVGFLLDVVPVGTSNRASYHVGSVAFPDGIRRVWLKKLAWTDGLVTAFTLRVPHREVLEAVRAAGAKGQAKLVRRLFVVLFGRDPTPDEVKYMTDELVDRRCRSCGNIQTITVHPNGVVGRECSCTAGQAAANPKDADDAR